MGIVLAALLIGVFIGLIAGTAYRSELPQKPEWRKYLD